MPVILAALLLLLRATLAAAETTIILDPATPSDVTVTRRTTDRSKRIYLTVPKSTVVNVTAPTPCTVILDVGGVIPWAALPGGAVVCLPDGHYPAIEPPAGLGGVTVRAVHWGKASVQGIDLAGNAVSITGLQVPCADCPGGSAVWSRTVSPP